MSFSIVKGLRPLIYTYILSFPGHSLPVSGALAGPSEEGVPNYLKKCLLS